MGARLCYTLSMATNVDPIMRRFRAALDEAYGDRIERVVLFGSRARGDARPDSDYDVAVFLKDMKEFGREVRVVAAIGSDILRDEGAVINAMPMPEGSYRDRTGFMGEIRRDGNRSVRRGNRRTRGCAKRSHAERFEFSNA